jgi:shikimate dehydrogenase
MPPRGAVSGATRVVAVIGDPVRHSLSPAIHNAAFAALGLDLVYVAFPVAAGRAVEAVEAVRLLDLVGLSVTMPHKAAVAASVDRCTPAARRLGAVNCVFRDGAHLVGDNTDGPGFLDAFIEATGRSVDGARVAVLGAGGAARAVIEAIGDAGAADVVVVNRSAEPAARAAALAPVGRVGGPGDVTAADVVVNATSVGMAGGPAPEGSPVDPEVLREGQIVCDLVYQPRCTPLLAAARDRGLTTVGGVGMLVHQAARAFEAWTGHRAPLAVMRAVVDGGAPSLAADR